MSWPLDEMGRRQHVRALITKMLIENPGLSAQEVAIAIDERLLAEGLIIIPRRRLAEHDGTIKPQPLSDRLLRIADRDRWICQICNGEVDPTLRVPDPRAPTLDHILPKSQFSNNDDSNLQLAHRICNNRRGNRPATFKLTHRDGVERVDPSAL